VRRTLSCLGTCWLFAVAIACTHGQAVPRTEGVIDIQTAVSLTDPADQFTRLQAIAGRPFLRGNEQTFLVDTTLSSTLAPGAKADVLITLTHNPSLSRQAKAHLLSRMRSDALPPAEKRKVLLAMIDSSSSRTGAGPDSSADWEESLRPGPSR